MSLLIVHCQQGQLWDELLYCSCFTIHYNLHRSTWPVRSSLSAWVCYMGRPVLLRLRELWWSNLERKKRRELNWTSPLCKQMRADFIGGNILYLSHHKDTLPCTNIPTPREPHPEQLIPTLPLKWVSEGRSKRDLREKISWKLEEWRT